jgi:hypothetical protein
MSEDITLRHGVTTCPDASLSYVYIHKDTNKNCSIYGTVRYGVVLVAARNQVLPKTVCTTATLYYTYIYNKKPNSQ